MKTINLSTLPGVGSWSRALHLLSVGGAVGMTCHVGDALIVSNGVVTEITADGVFADMPRVVDPKPKRVHGIWAGGIEINTGKPVRRGAVRHGQPVHVIERYPSGRNCQVSGKVEAVIGDGFRVAGQWFDYGTKQDGEARKLAIIGGG